jgi:outer membrane lipoprotein-sorting protein
MGLPAHRRLAHFLFLGLLLLLGVQLRSQAQQGDLDSSPPKGMTPEEVIQRFAAKEKEWKQARELYTFRQEVKVRVLDGEMEMGEYRNVADISYAAGRRVKTAVLSPQPGIEMSREDLDDLETRASFTISKDELPEYNVVYAGQQKVDELHCYIFEVAPKAVQKDKRYFKGRIWVDDQDFQIVKNTGKSFPDIKIVKKKKIEENLFPQFTTWRQLIDGKYWFPTFSSADDTLHFHDSDVRIKQVLKFTNYRRAGAEPGKDD